MFKINKKISYAFIAGTCLIASSNESRSAENTIVERNCHECPNTETLIERLNAIKIHRDRNKYEPEAFHQYQVTCDDKPYIIENAYVEQSFWNLWGHSRNFTFFPFGFIPIPIQDPVHLNLPIFKNQLKLVETTKDSEGIIRCTYSYHSSSLSSPTFYFVISDKTGNFSE